MVTPSAQDERDVILAQIATLHGKIVCRCGHNMFTTTHEYRAVCYNPDCEHYRVTFTVVYPPIVLVQYADTEPIKKL